MRRSILSLFFSLASACGSPAPAAPPDPPASPEVAAPAAPPEEEEAAPEPIVEVTPTAHDVLLLVLHDEELLPSESRVLGVLEERMRRRHHDVEMRDATEEEAALARLFFDPEASPEARAAASLPSTFGAARKVVVLHIPAPRTLRDGNRRTNGFSGALLFQPPSVEPAFSLAIEDSSFWRLTDDQWSSWLAGLLRDAEGA